MIGNDIIMEMQLDQLSAQLKRIKNKDKADKGNPVIRQREFF